MRWARGARRPSTIRRMLPRSSYRCMPPCSSYRRMLPRSSYRRMLPRSSYRRMLPRSSYRHMLPRSSYRRMPVSSQIRCRLRRLFVSLDTGMRRYDDVRYDDVRYNDVRYEVWFYREALFICAIRRRRTSLGEALGRGRSPCVPGLIFSCAKRAPSMSLRANSSLITVRSLPSRARP